MRPGPMRLYWGGFGAGVGGAGAGVAGGVAAGAELSGAGVAGVPVAGGVDAGAGVVAGGGVVAGAGAGGAGVPPTTDPGPRWPMMARTSAPSMNSTANAVVILDSSVAPPRAPNAVWLLPPPNALAMSPPLPCCRRITSSSTRQTKTYAAESK